jgi:MerR family transcriptional regulator, copper efflux regulator
MLIGEVAQKTGFSKDTIRYYEKIGLLEKADQNRGENNYRKYNEQIISKLNLIKKVKTFGFTLNEIKDLFLYEKHDLFNCNSLADVLKEKLQQIENQIARLIIAKQKLKILQTDCDGHCKEMIKKV